MEEKKSRGRAKLAENLNLIAAGAGRGRAKLKSLCLDQSSEKQLTRATHFSTSALSDSAGPSSALDVESLSNELSTVHLEKKKAKLWGRGKRKGKEQKEGKEDDEQKDIDDDSDEDDDVSSEEKEFVKMGEFGDRINISTNHIKLYTDPSKVVYEYKVCFTPELEFLNYRHRILYEHFPGKKEILCYDGGSKLFSPEQITADQEQYISNHPGDDSITVTMSVTLKNLAKAKDCAALYNTLLHNCSRILKFSRFGSKYFDHRNSIKIPQHKLEIWPGFVTSVDEFDGGIQLRCDINYRVLRTDTALDVLTCLSRQDHKDLKRVAENELLGQCVLTRYNNNLYRIDDIDWTKSPLSTFMLQSGDEITFLHYYKRQYNIDIVDLKQPLLINRAKDKAGNKTRLICLLPEICYMTGLTDRMRTDVKVMKDIAIYTRIKPSQRAYAFKQYLSNMKSSKEVQELLGQWGLSITDEPVQLAGRNLRSEPVMFGKSKIIGTTNADWTKSLRDVNVYRPVDILHWILFYPKNTFRVTDAFSAMLRNIGPGLGLEIAEPIRVVLKDDRVETYVNSLRSKINRKTQIVVCICPTAREDRYCAIKKLCCKEIPIPSQIVNTITLSRDDRMRAVVQNIALQMNHKLGGAGWAIKIPFHNTMVCGVDVYHERFHNVGSVGGFVASSDSDFTEWFSRTNFQEPKQELVAGVVDAFIAALKHYSAKNNCLPERIIVYRDGVSSGQLEICQSYEIPQFLDACEIICPDYKPKFSYIVVQKRIATRFYEVLGSGGEKIINPRPGGIVDDVVTNKNYYDFYLVSQFVRIGTATPTHYLVLYDNSNLAPDHIQRLTYKFCHLYYNWPGAIRVPAPCQYAHKLAYLVGQNIKCMPSESLANKLFYL